MAAPDSNLSQRQSTSHLPSPLRNLARGLWIILVGWALAQFILGIPASYEKASRLTPETVQWLTQNNLPQSFAPNALLAVDCATMLFFSSVALFLFWRRSDDWIAMLVALLFVLTAAIYTSPTTDAPIPIWLAAIPI